MSQQTHRVQNHDHKIVYKANARYGQTFIGILQVIWGAIRKITANGLIVFHTFVESTEQQASPQNEYWWNSPDTVTDLMKR